MPSESDQANTGHAGESPDQHGLDIKRHTAATLCTKALYLFLKRHSEIFDFLFFAVHLATTHDHNSFIAAKFLAEEIDQEQSESRLAEVEQLKDHSFKQLRKFAALQSENMCIGTVDNFLSYLSDTIQSCMKSRPEMLRSSETIKIEDVLRFDSRELLIEFIVERHINELSYAGIKGINDFLLDRTGIELWASDEERTLSSVSVGLRNIYTHNRVIINETFLKKTRGLGHQFKFSLGRPFHADLGKLCKSSDPTAFNSLIGIID